MSDLDNNRIPGERTLEVQEMTRAMAGSAKAADLFIERSQTTTALIII
jgi:hypothetical protein